MLLYVRGSVVDLASDCPISLNYDLNSDRDLSSFTTTYSKELVLPLTRGNRVIFEHPTESIIRGSYDYYILADDGSKVDEGSLVIDRVDDDGIHCHLYGSLVDLNSKLGSIEYLSKCIVDGYMRDANNVSHPVNFYNQQTEEYDIPNFIVKSERFFSDGNTMRTWAAGDSYGDRGLLYYGMTNIGKPKEFDVASMWKYDAATGVLNREQLDRDYQVLEMSRSFGGGRGVNMATEQYRPYQLQPFIRVPMLFNNVIRYASDLGYNLTISANALDVLSQYNYLTPKLDDVFFKTDKSQAWSKADSVVSTTSGTVATRTGYSNGLSLRKLGFNYSNYNLDTDGNYYFAFYIATVSDGTDSHDYLVCPDTSKHNFGDAESMYKLAMITYHAPSYEKAVTTDGTISVPFVSELSETYTVSYKTVVLVMKKGKKTNKLVAVNQFNYAASLINLSTCPPVSTSYVDVEFSVSDTVNNSGYIVFSYDRYFQCVAKPWDIVKRICKKFNIRLKAKSLKEYEFVTGREYYANVPVDITESLDFTNASYESFVFPSKKIVFADEPTDSSWVSGYSELDSVPYGGVKVVNYDYPVESEKKWFDNPLHCTSSIVVRHGLYGSDLVVTEPPMYEACDKNGDEVSISDCLAFDETGMASSTYAYLVDDTVDSDTQCYFYTVDLDASESIIPQSMIHRKFMYIAFIGATSYDMFEWECKDRCCYGAAKFNPSHITTTNDFINEHFGDVKDSINSGTYTCGVFMRELGMSINDFIHTVFNFNNAYWVVSSVASYDPMSKDPTRVKFIRVGDLDNYLPGVEVTITATSSDVTKGTVSPASQDVRVGRTAVVTATPNTGYVLTAWTENGTVVSYDTEYSFVATTDRALVAVFGVAPTTYHLKVTGEQYGTVTTLIGLGIERVGDFELDVEENTQLTFSWEVKPDYEGFYKFHYWDVNGEEFSGDEVYEDEMNRDITIVAHSQPIEDNDFYASTSYGKLSGTVAGETFTNQTTFTKRNISGAYNVSVTWSADGSGKELTEWIVSIGGTEVSPRPGGNPYVLEGVDDDVTVTPVLRDPVTYAFSANSTISGSTISGEVGGTSYTDVTSISKNNVGAYSVSLTWDAGTSGKVFSKWRVAHGGGTDDYDTPTLSLPNIAYDASVTVVATDPVLGYALNLESMANLETFSVYNVTEQEAYTLGELVDQGTVLQVTAKPSSHRFITQWNDTVSGSVINAYPLSFSLTMNANVMLSGSFIEGARSLIIVPETGSFTLSDFPMYTNVQLSGTAYIDLPVGYYGDFTCDPPTSPTEVFDAWVDDDGAYTTNYTWHHAIYSGLELQAIYLEVTTYSLTKASIVGGSIRVYVNGNEVTSFPADIYEGDEITATNTPSQGYAFKSYTINGTEVESLPYTVVGDTVIGAEFESLVTFSGFKLYDGTVLNDGDTLYVWEHGSVNPVWVLTDGAYSDISVSVDSNKFSAYRKVDNLIVIADVSGVNDNYQFTANVTVTVGGVAHVLHVILEIEYQGSSFLYNYNGNVFDVVDVASSGATTYREFFNGEGWYGRGGSTTPPVDAFLPTTSSGYGAAGIEWNSANQCSQDNLEDFVVSSSITGMNYSYYTLTSPSRDYLNFGCNLSFPVNNSGSTKYYLLKISSSFFHDGYGTEVPSVIVFVQNSN